MAKKNFAAGIDAILGGDSSRAHKKHVNRENAGKKRNLDVRTSVHLDQSLLEKLRAIAVWDRSTLKVEVEKAIRLYIESKSEEEINQALDHFRQRSPNGKIYQ